MILRHKLLEKYDRYTFKLPISGKDKVLVSKGDRVTQGVSLFAKTESSVKHSFYIPDQLGCNVTNAYQYVTCIDGEFVKEGDVLAEKLAMGGLTVKTLLAPANGIVELSRVKNGYIDILGEEQEQTFKSSFDAEIIDINPLDGITFETSALALDLLSISNTEKETLSGEFVTLNTGKDIRLKAEDTSYDGKVVFVGKHLHVDLLNDLFQKGAKFVLTYAMDYQDFRNQGLPLGIIGGFGEIYSSKLVLDTLEKLNGSFVVVDFEENQMFFLKKQLLESKIDSLFVKSLVGSKIISRAQGSYGLSGEIVEVEDASYVTVEWEGSGRSVVNLGCLEFVTY